MVRSKYKIKEVELNNKARKGKYIYISEKGKSGKYYKKNEKLKEKDYIEIYKGEGLRSKRGGISKEKIKVIRRVKKKKLVEIEKSLRSGYAQTTVNNANKLTPYGIKTAYMNLLRNKDKVGDKLGIVRDKELLDILTRTEDVEKWKHRVLYGIELIGDKGEILAKMTNKNPKTLYTISSELKEIAKEGRELGNEYEANGIKGDAEKKGYNYEGIGKGKIKNIRIKLVFRKQ